ncbi:MAG TPA: hypothetical protein PLL69_11950 [Gemmatimonadales bacterium]|nr:hypothetical protein [Gemmatimonadales bacterium]
MLSSRIATGSMLAVLTLFTLPLAAQDDKRGAETASAAVEQFMKAAADSNLTRMAELFGTDKGSAARTGNPPDFARRMVIMQAALSGISVHAAGETTTSTRDHKVVTTELIRGRCSVTVPVTAVRAREGWLVRRFDLPAVWEGINRPCEGTATMGNSDG